MCGPGNNPTMVRVTRGYEGLTPQSLLMCSWSGDLRLRLRQSSSSGGDLSQYKTLDGRGGICSRSGAGLAHISRGGYGHVCTIGRSFALWPVQDPLVIAPPPARTAPHGCARPNARVRGEEDAGGHKPSTHPRLDGAQANMLTPSVGGGCSQSRPLGRV